MDSFCFVYSSGSTRYKSVKKFQLNLQRKIADKLQWLQGWKNKSEVEKKENFWCICVCQWKICKKNNRHYQLLFPSGKLWENVKYGNNMNMFCILFRFTRECFLSLCHIGQAHPIERDRTILVNWNTIWNMSQIWGNHLSIWL